MTRQVDRPLPGFWAMRLARHGAEVGACIAIVQTLVDPDFPDNLMERSPFMVAFLNGAVADPYEVWTRKGREITEAEYQHLVKDREWARQWMPESPEANPKRSVNPRQSAPVF